MTRRNSRRFAALTISAVALAGTRTLAQTLYALQDRRGPAYPKAISADGSTAVGYIQLNSSGSATSAFRWTAAGGVAPLIEFDSGAQGVSEDGSVVIGEWHSNTSQFTGVF